MKKGYLELASQYRQENKFKKAKDSVTHEGYLKSRQDYYRHVSQVQYYQKLNVEQIFWEKLVQLGWKWRSEDDHKNLILQCPECDEMLKNVAVSSIELVKSVDKLVIEAPQLIESHSKAICKAIAKAPPKGEA
jgi:uncharacterized C2H2 Zn-finger protein